jgi:hypothetical protein
MIENKFNIVFSMQVLHSYFKEGICNSLLFTPAPATEKLIKRYGFKIRQKINGFDFYTNASSSITDFLTHIQQTTGDTFFEFEIHNTNPNFNIFTELPVNWMGQIQYDTHTRVATTGAIIQLQAIFESKNAPPPFGNLKIQFDNLLALQTSNQLSQFEIQYHARATQWQYYIINTSAIPLENPMVKGKSDIQFVGPTNITIQTGQEALLFSSGEQFIPMSEIPTYKFDLINTINSQTTTIKNATTSKTIFKGLPNPNPGRIGTVEVNGEKKVTSPMYVYV